MTLFEALEPRLLLAASVTTDKMDYAPGATALVNGSGFIPGEAVRLQVRLIDGTPALGSNPWQVADGNNSFTDPYLDGSFIWHYPDLDGQVDGNIQTTWYVDPADETNATMQLTATGLSSGEVAQTTFTDSASITNVGTASDTNSNSNSLTVTLPSAIAVGNTVIVTVALKTTDAGTVSVTDAAGDSYHIDANITNSSGVRLVVLSAPVTTALSAGSTITVRTPTNISDKAVQVSKANAAFEAATTSTGSDGYPTSSAVTASVSNASYLILGVNAALTSGSESSYSINHPFYKVGSAASQPGNPSNTIVWTASQGVIGQPGSLYPSGSFPQYNIIGQLNTAGPWAGAILSYKEVSTTTSTITYPVNGGTYGSGTWSGTIRGSASSANTVTQVRLSIRDTTAGKYWNGTSWNGIAATRLAASGTTSWTYASFPAASLTQGHSYTVTSYATDNQGYTQVPGTTSTFSYPDTTPPTVSSVIVTPPPASYFLKAADVLTITVNFSEAVTVTRTPRLALNTTPTAYATYASGTGTTVLKFSYTVVAGQNSPRLAYTSTAALTLNGGTIRDAAGNNAILTLVAPGSGMDNLYYQNFVIDTTVPVVSSVSVSPSPTGTSPTISAVLTDVNPAATSRIAAGEYFVDVLGAPGTGTSLSLSPAGSSTCTGSALVSGFAGLGGGAHIIYVRAKDSAGNWSAAANTSFVKDSAMPAVTVTAPVSPANQDPIPFTVTFTQNVTGLSTAGFAVTNGTVVGLSGSGTTYTVLVDPAGSGAVTCQVLANAAENAIVPGKFNTPSNVASVTCDGVAPALSSLSLQYQSAGAYMKAGSSVTFGLTFSEVVSITGTPQLRLNTGATVNYSSGSGTTTLYFGTYVVAAGQNAAPLDFASDGALVGTIKDAAGNAVVSPTPGPSSLLYVKNITVDTAAPTPVVSTPGTATNTSPITFAINFSEVLKSTPVLTNSNLTVTGGTLGTLSNNGTSYAVPVTPTGQGPVTLLVKAGAVQDRAGNASTVSNTASVIYDSVAPTIGASATKADATAYAAGTWTNQNVTVHFIASDVTSGVASVTADTTVNTEGVTASVSGTATDRAGNSVGATFGPIWIDKMAPDTSIDSGPSNPTNSESASFAFSGTDATSGIAGFEYKLDSGNWTAGSSPLALSSLADGSHTLQIRATDHAGNTDATPASQTWVVDTVAPDTVSTSLVGSSLTNASTVLFVVTFSENVTGVAPSDFTISTTGTLAGTSVTVVSGSDRVYTVTVDTGTGNGTLRLDVKASATIRDTAGNPLASAFNTGPTYTIDKSGSNGVVGTDGNDTFRIRPAPASYSPGTVLVYWLTTVGRRRVESLVRVFSPNERIMVSGGKGNDTLEVVGDIIRPVFLYGGSGNDVLKGGGGDDVLVGGDGQDVLTGGWGRDILIGGASADRLYGGIPNRSTNADDQNILIGDATVYDNNDLALLAMQQAWSNRLQPIETRVSALREGTGSLDVRLTSTTVLDDTAVDQIFNSTGRNWFWNVAKRDKLIGWRKDIDFID